MEKFNWTSFEIKIAIKAPLQSIYNAWTIPSEIEKWFLKTAVFKNQLEHPVLNDETISAGDTYQWMWHLYTETEKGKIISANGTDFISFTFAGECLVEVKLSSDKEYTIVQLTQSNIPTDDNSKKNIRLGCYSGWSFYLVNLKSIYEGGLDLRNKDERLAPMLNS